MTLILPNFTSATTQGTYVTYRPPETPPSQGNQWFPLKPPPLIMIFILYLILIIRLT